MFNLRKLGMRQHKTLDAKGRTDHSVCLGRWLNLFGAFLLWFGWDRLKDIALIILSVIVMICEDLRGDGFGLGR